MNEWKRDVCSHQGDLDWEFLKKSQSLIHPFQHLSPHLHDPPTKVTDGPSLSSLLYFFPSWQCRHTYAFFMEHHITQKTCKLWLAGMTAAKKLVVQRWLPPHDLFLY